MCKGTLSGSLISDDMISCMMTIDEATVSVVIALQVNRSVVDVVIWLLLRFATCSREGRGIIIRRGQFGISSLSTRRTSQYCRYRRL